MNNDNNAPLVRTYLDYAYDALFALEKFEQFIYNNQEDPSIDFSVLRVALLSMESLIRNIIRNSSREVDEDDFDQDGYPEPPY